MWVCVCVRRVPTAWRHCSNTVAATATVVVAPMERAQVACVTYGIVLRCASVRACVRKCMCTHVYNAHTPILLSREKQRRTTPRPMCRTGSASIRPDSCGLLYAPQVLSFLRPLSLSLSPAGLPSSPPLVVPPLVLLLQLVRPFFRSLPRFVPKHDATLSSSHYSLSLSLFSLSSVNLFRC